MKVNEISHKHKGSIPLCGEIFRVHKGSGIYLRVCWDGYAASGPDCILGASLQTGKIHELQNTSSRRDGFVILEPVNGVMDVERKKIKE